MKHLACMLLAILFAPLTIADERYSHWTQGTSLENCRDCKSTAFHENVRKRYSNQSRSHTNYAGAVGYVVVKLREYGGLVRKGRIVLMGTGRLARTDSHVIYNEREEFHASDDGKMYFEPMLHPGEENLVEIDLESVETGSKYTAPMSKNRLDWANVFLKEDVIRKFKSEKIFALLWYKNITHGLFQDDDFRKATKYVQSENARLLLADYCPKVDRKPTDFYKLDSINGISFANCPKHQTRRGSSGSPTIVTRLTGLYFGNQIITNENEIPEGGPTGSGRLSTIPQSFLGLTPESKRSLNRMYAEDLRSRGVVIVID